MLSMLLAYDDDGNVIATLDHMTVHDAAGTAVGLVDFATHEAALTDVWVVDGAKGSTTWPEWLGGQALGFRVEFEGPPGRERAAALVHRISGYRRERAVIEAAVAARVANSPEVADVRDLVGGPDRPLVLDELGRTLGRSAPPDAPPLRLVRIERPE